MCDSKPVAAPKTLIYRVMVYRSINGKNYWSVRDQFGTFDDLFRMGAEDIFHVHGTGPDDPLQGLIDEAKKRAREMGIELDPQNGAEPETFADAHGLL